MDGETEGEQPSRDKTRKLVLFLTLTLSQDKGTVEVAETGERILKTSKAQEAATYM